MTSYLEHYSSHWRAPRIVPIGNESLIRYPATNRSHESRVLAHTFLVTVRGVAFAVLWEPITGKRRLSRPALVEDLGMKQGQEHGAQALGLS